MRHGLLGLQDEPSAHKGRFGGTDSDSVIRYHLHFKRHFLPIAGDVFCLYVFGVKGVRYGARLVVL